MVRATGSVVVPLAATMIGDWILESGEPLKSRCSSTTMTSQSHFERCKNLISLIPNNSFRTLGPSVRRKYDSSRTHADWQVHCCSEYLWLQSNGFNAASLVTTVLLTVEASPIAAPKTYILLVDVLLISIAVVAIGQVAANLLMSRRPFGPMP